MGRQRSRSDQQHSFTYMWDDEVFLDIHELLHTSWPAGGDTIKAWTTRTPSPHKHYLQTSQKVTDAPTKTWSLRMLTSPAVWFSLCANSSQFLHGLNLDLPNATPILTRAWGLKTSVLQARHPCQYFSLPVKATPTPTNYLPKFTEVLAQDLQGLLQELLYGIALLHLHCGETRVSLEWISLSQCKTSKDQWLTYKMSPFYGFKSVI